MKRPWWISTCNRDLTGQSGSYSSWCHPGVMHSSESRNPHMVKMRCHHMRIWWLLTSPYAHMVFSSSALVLAKLAAYWCNKLRKTTPTKTRKTTPLQSERTRELARRTGSKESSEQFLDNSINLLWRDSACERFHCAWEPTTPWRLAAQHPSCLEDLELSKHLTFAPSRWANHETETLYLDNVSSPWEETLSQYNVSVPWRALRKSD